MTEHDVRVEPGTKRVRVYVGGTLIADTTAPLYVWEHRYYPAYYIPLSDVRREFVVASNTKRRVETLGDAEYFTVTVDGDERVDAAWRYPTSPVPELRDHVRFDWRAMDAWFEEDEEVFVHPRSPYTRIDVLPSSRSIRVEIDGVVLAESTRAHVLHETGLPPRWYLPKEDVRMDLLDPTDQVTACPYKGEAEYWSARVGDGVVENVAWSYPTPLPESERVTGLVAFYNERADFVIDGERHERPKTKFS